MKKKKKKKKEHKCRIADRISRGKKK